ncbi:hypothetical protein K3495_g5757 [Podosphaera aphanis]|nr:hypothetical protein K3495_g5757 [Podosphaera aphanis]
MVVVWGLDLREIQLSKLKSSYMFSHEYHLRRTKMVAYQSAMILCVCSESLGTRALSNYVDLRHNIFTRSNGQAVMHVRDIVTIMSCNILIGIAVATIFGSGFFFDLFWPERVESRGIKLTWRISSVAICIAALAVAVIMTIIVATRSASLSGIIPQDIGSYFEAYPNPNPVYRKNPYCLAAIIFLWLGVIASIFSSYAMHKTIVHNNKHGPKSFKSRVKEEAALETRCSNVENFFAPNT